MQYPEAEVSCWSLSTESDSAQSESEQVPQAPLTPRSPFTMSEARSNVITKIRSIVSNASPAKKNNEFQTLQSTPNSYANLTNATPLTTIPTTRTVRSGKTILSKARTNDSANLANSRTTLLHNTTPNATLTPKPEPSASPAAADAPKTPPTGTKSPATKSCPGKTLPPGGSFELAPLSSLIKQSYADIALLRRLHTAPLPTLPAATYSPKSNSSPNIDIPSNDCLLIRSPKEKEIQQVLIDFDKIEGNLKKFEEMYRQFLRYGGRHGEKAEEVHLVAVVCKRSDVVRGKMGEGEGVPRVKRVWVDCGF